MLALLLTSLLFSSVLLMEFSFSRTEIASAATEFQPSCEARRHLPMPSGDTGPSHEAWNHSLSSSNLGHWNSAWFSSSTAGQARHCASLNAEIFQVTAKAAKSSKYLSQVESDTSVFPGHPARHFWDDTMDPPTLICWIPLTLLLFTGPPWPVVALFQINVMAPGCRFPGPKRKDDRLRLPTPEHHRDPRSIRLQ